MVHKFYELIKDDKIIVLDNNFRKLNMVSKYPYKLGNSEVLISFYDNIYLIYNSQHKYVNCYFNEDLRYIQTTLYLENYNLNDGYTKYIINNIDKPENILVLGLCIGNMPNSLVSLKKQIKNIDCVEINPILCKIYNTYFKISDKIKVYEKCAHEYIMETSKKYDTIIIDIPCKFITNKFVSRIKKVLKNSGKVYINLIGKDSNKITKKMFEDFNNIIQTKLDNNNLFILN